MTGLLAAFLMAGLGFPASAAPKHLDNVELQNAAAGMVPVDPVPVVPHPPIIGRPMPINPGGPILISCHIGSGCTTTHVA